MERVAVFIDYENAHRGGHGRFGGVGEPKYETVIDPLKIAKRILEKRRSGGDLAGVHVYRGRPLPMFQPEATSANDLLAAAWEADGVNVVRRDLRYVVEDDGSWRAEEKGIDVALAIGAVESAMNGDFDTAVVFSNDTDQLPTLELLFHKLQPRVEIACWSTAKPLWFPEGLRSTPPRRLPFCHFLDEQDFISCRDTRGTGGL
ncbi:NYN domain-containing protein [Nocardioides plantarum]|uniref:NYN domain-containing protein n=1 Tax=Nocardioides plantarum TaxID=29299 RepID=A0ABV5K9F5_9ACTN|nr:NYN domain-containing protein [Nocardioides plantarum]